MTVLHLYEMKFEIRDDLSRITDRIIVRICGEKRKIA